MKYIKKKIIKGKEYYYMSYYLGQRSQKTYNRYIGKELPDNLSEQMQQFFEEIAAITAQGIHNTYFFKQHIQAIETARFRHILLNHELFEKEKRLFKTLFYILFVLNSNRSEGSEVTREDIEKIMASRMHPKTSIDREIVNSIAAINFAFSGEMKWNPQSIKQIHGLLFWDLHPVIAGKYKKVNNIVGNAATTPWKEVPQEMKNLLEWFHNNKKSMYPPQLAVEFHWRFEAIHPFQDGNGRVGRILLNSFLVQQGYAPVIYFTENHSAYCNAISKAVAGHSQNLAIHYIQSVKKTEKAIEQYKQTGIIQDGSPKVGKWEIQRGKIRIS